MRDPSHRRQWRIATLAVLLVLALVVVFRPEEEPRRPTPADLGATAHLDVAYGDHERQRLDVYTPPVPGPHPTVVWLHGGGWVAGDKSRGIPVWEWTERGYAVVAVNYRYAEAPLTIADSVDDAIAAVTHLVDNSATWHLDPQRIGVYGFSAGGHLAAMVAHADVGAALVVTSAGPTEFVTLVDPARSVFEGRDSAEAAALIRTRLDCEDDACVGAATAVSPALLPAGPAPMLILHGATDLIVDSSQAEALFEHLDEAGAAVELRIIDEVGHAIMDETRIEQFFDSHLLDRAG